MIKYKLVLKDKKGNIFLVRSGYVQDKGAVRISPPKNGPIIGSAEIEWGCESSEPQ